MRTETNISNIVSTAKIIYSYRLQIMEAERERGLSEGELIEYFEISNVLNAINVSSTTEKNLLVDVLVRKGYTSNTNNLLFSENIYNTNFDLI